jgi:hypothetical protein
MDGRSGRGKMKINRGLSPLPRLCRKMEYSNGIVYEPITPEDFLRLCDEDELEYFKAIIIVLQGIASLERQAGSKNKR